MLKKELMQKTGLTRDTVRHYEKLGLLHPNRLENSYFDYPENSVARIELIRRAKLLGMTLKEMAVLIAPWESGETCDQEKIEILEVQLHKIEAGIDDLIQTKKHLINKLNGIRSAASSHL